VKRRVNAPVSPVEHNHKKFKRLPIHCPLSASLTPALPSSLLPLSLSPSIPPRSFYAMYPELLDGGLYIMGER